MRDCRIRAADREWGGVMNLCDYCKSRNTWDCEDTICHGCSDFSLDFESLPDDVKEETAKLAIGYVMIKEKDL